MFIKIGKKEITKLVIANVVFSTLILLLSMYAHSFVMYGLDHGKLLLHQRIIATIGQYVSCYLLSIGFLLPQQVQESLIGGVFAFVSAFIMTTPFMLAVFFIYKKTRKKLG